MALTGRMSSRVWKKYAYNGLGMKQSTAIIAYLFVGRVLVANRTFKGLW